MCLKIISKTDDYSKFKEQIQYIWDQPSNLAFYIYETSIHYRPAMVLHTIDLDEQPLINTIVQDTVDSMKKSIKDGGSNENE